MFTDGYICSVVAPVIPYLIQDSSLVPPDRVQMATSIIVACFGVSDIVGGPLCAWYIDTTSNRRAPFLAGLAFMATGTFLFGLGNALWILAVGRVVQGFASSILYTAGLAVLVDTVDKDEVGKWMGTAMSCNNIALILSPVLGGIMYEVLGRSCVFISMLVLILVDAMLRILMVDKPTKSTKTRARHDEYQLHGRQSVESEASNEAVARLLAHDRPSTHSGDDANLSTPTPLSEKKPTVTIITTTSLPSPSPSPSLTISPRRIQRPPPPPSRLTGILQLIKSPRLLAALYGTFVNEALVSSLCAILPLYASHTFHWSSLISGLLFLTIAIPGFGGPLAGHLADRLGARPVAIAGFLLTAPSLAALRFVDDVGSGGGKNQLGQKILLCLLLVTSGFTIIFFLSPLGADLSQVADEVQHQLQQEYESQCSSISRRASPSSSSRTTDSNDDFDFASDSGETYSAPTLYASTFSMMNCALATATVFGPLVTGGLNQAYGWKTATAFLGAMSLSGAVPCWFFTGQKRADESGRDGYTVVRGVDQDDEESGGCREVDWKKRRGG